MAEIKIKQYKEHYASLEDPVRGGSGASEKFQKQQAQKEGAGAPNAPGRTEGGVSEQPGKAAVASDSGSTAVGVERGANNPGEKGISGVPVDPAPEGNTQNMK